MLGWLGELRIKADFLTKYYTQKPYADQSWTDVASRQRLRFEHLLQHVWDHSTFYRALYHDAGITKSDIPDIRLTDLPIIDKDMVMAHFNDLVCVPALQKSELQSFIDDPKNLDKRYRGRYTVIHTSGSSGTIGIFCYDARELNVVNLLFVKTIDHVNSLLDMLDDRICFLGVTGGHYAAYTLAKRASDYDLPFLPLSVETPMEEIVAQLNRFQPTMLVAYSAMLSQLAEEQLAARLQIAPRLIIGGAEPLLPRYVEACRDAFGQAPRNIYGASESIIIGAETHHGDGMYLFSDWTTIETLDEKDRPVASGDLGQAVLTNLYNYTQPLIRYRMNDVLCVDREPDQSQQLPLAVITEIQGRTEEFLTFERNGREVAIHPIVFVEFYVPGLRQLQIVKTRRTRFQARVSLDVDSDRSREAILAQIRHRLDKILENYDLKDTVAFDVYVVGKVSRESSSGKYKLVIDETE